MTKEELLKQFKELTVGNCRSHGCNDCNYCFGCNDCNYCFGCNYCTNCNHCNYCDGCTNCILCKNLKNKTKGFWLLNKEVSEEEFNQANELLK